MNYTETINALKDSSHQLFMDNENYELRDKIIHALIGNTSFQKGRFIYYKFTNEYPVGVLICGTMKHGGLPTIKLSEVVEDCKCEFENCQRDSRKEKVIECDKCKALRNFEQNKENKEILKFASTLLDKLLKLSDKQFELQKQRLDIMRRNELDLRIPKYSGIVYAKKPIMMHPTKMGKEFNKGVRKEYDEKLEILLRQANIAVDSVTDQTNGFVPRSMVYDIVNQVKNWNKNRPKK